MNKNKIVAGGLAVGTIIACVPFNSFANNTEDKYEINKIESKEDLEKSAQRAVKAGEVDTWITGLASMPTARSSFTSEVIDGKIYCIGGRNAINSYLNTVEVYDTKTDTWETKASMPTTLGDFTSVVVDEKIYCIGGQIELGYRNKTVYVYDPATDSWETKTDMPTARTDLTSAVVDGKIYCIGGHNGSVYLNTVEVYDPATDSWETKTDMPYAIGTLTSVVINGKIHCRWKRKWSFTLFEWSICI